MIKQVKLLLTLLLISAGLQAPAQTIDSFYVNRLVNPHELFVRMHFPDSSYYISRTFDRVALIYPPVNIVTFYYRSCDFVKADPVKDTIIRLYTPEPYGLNVWLVRDSNTVVQECDIVWQTEDADSVSYYSPTTGVVNPDIGNKALQIYPNPANSVLHVLAAPGCTLIVSDALGRRQLQQSLHSEHETVNISGLSSGVYFIHCYRDGRLLQSLRFSKLP
ncbi:T9SS type A sorting domain-containing protein [Edaphocola aurantiacus]|uniref:T9SS type A sorting domain-containing protein n=1 Tax=Edaphocola aurantiacus TaxID=2601682 RepID=UPI001C93A909|nr:T9SS type A sorting domain-containing protein [Edaphocola aurantiacus]